MRSVKPTACLVASVVICGLSVHWGVQAGSQGSGAKKSSKDLGTRGLHSTKTAHAMRVTVLDAQTGAAVPANRQFSEDNRLKVVIESNFECYAYIVNVEIAKTAEKRFLLYPNPHVANNLIKLDASLELSV